ARDIDFAFGRYNLLERSRIHHRPMRVRIAMWTIKEKPDVRIEQKVVFRAESVFLDSLRFHPSLVQGLPNDSVYSIWVLEILLSVSTTRFRSAMSSGAMADTDRLARIFCSEKSP